MLRGPHHDLLLIQAHHGEEMKEMKLLLPVPQTEDGSGAVILPQTKKLRAASVGRQTSPQLPHGCCRARSQESLEAICVQN